MFPFLSPIAVAHTNRSIFHCAVSLNSIAFSEFPVALIFYNCLKNIPTFLHPSSVALQMAHPGRHAIVSMGLAFPHPTGEIIPKAQSQSPHTVIYCCELSGLDKGQSTWYTAHSTNMLLPVLASLPRSKFHNNRSVHVRLSSMGRHRVTGHRSVPAISVLFGLGTLCLSSALTSCGSTIGWGILL